MLVIIVLILCPIVLYIVIHHEVVDEASNVDTAIIGLNNSLVKRQDYLMLFESLNLSGIHCYPDMSFQEALVVKKQQDEAITSISKELQDNVDEFTLQVTESIKIYNNNVRRYNTLLKIFPSNIIAKHMHLEERPIIR